MCKDILFVQVAGVDIDFAIYHGERWVRGRWDNLKLQLVRHRMDYDNTISPPKLTRLIYLMRQRFREMSFAKRIPKIRSAISTVTEKLILFQILVVE